MKGYLKENKNKAGKTISFRIGAPMGKDPVTGKHQYHFETIKTDTKKSAEKRLREVLTELDRGTFTKPKKQTVRDYFESTLAHPVS